MQVRCGRWACWRGSSGDELGAEGGLPGLLSRSLGRQLPPTQHAAVAALSQVSPRTRWLVASDWVRMQLFGRNVSDI